MGAPSALNSHSPENANCDEAPYAFVTNYLPDASR